MHDGSWFWGMHWIWWLFWVALIALIAGLWARRTPDTPFDAHSPDERPETPLEILQRRYAAGEISTEEFEERKARLAP